MPRLPTPPFQLVLLLLACLAAAQEQPQLLDLIAPIPTLPVRLPLPLDTPVPQAVVAPRLSPAGRPGVVFPPAPLEVFPPADSRADLPLTDTDQEPLEYITGPGNFEAGSKLVSSDLDEDYDLVSLFGEDVLHFPDASDHVDAVDTTTGKAKPDGIHHTPKQQPLPEVTPSSVVSSTLSLPTFNTSSSTDSTNSSSSSSSLSSSIQQQQQPDGVVFNTPPPVVLRVNQPADLNEVKENNVRVDPLPVIVNEPASPDPVAAVVSAPAVRRPVPLAFLPALNAQQQEQHLQNIQKPLLHQSPKQNIRQNTQQQNHQQNPHEQIHQQNTQHQILQQNTHPDLQQLHYPQDLRHPYAPAFPYDNTDPGQFPPSYTFIAPAPPANYPKPNLGGTLLPPFPSTPSATSVSQHNPAQSAQGHGYGSPPHHYDSNPISGSQPPPASKPSSYDGPLFRPPFSPSKPQLHNPPHHRPLYPASAPVPATLSALAEVSSYGEVPHEDYAYRPIVLLKQKQQEEAEPVIPQGPFQSWISTIHKAGKAHIKKKFFKHEKFLNGLLGEVEQEPKEPLEVKTSDLLLHIDSVPLGELPPLPALDLPQLKDDLQHESSLELALQKPLPAPVFDRATPSPVLVRASLAPTHHQYDVTKAYVKASSSSPAPYHNAYAPASPAPYPKPAYNPNLQYRPLPVKITPAVPIPPPFTPVATLPHPSDAHPRPDYSPLTYQLNYQPLGRPLPLPLEGHGIDIDEPTRPLGLLGILHTIQTAFERAQQNYRSVSRGMGRLWPGNWFSPTATTGEDASASPLKGYTGVGFGHVFDEEPFDGPEKDLNHGSHSSYAAPIEYEGSNNHLFSGVSSKKSYPPAKAAPTGGSPFKKHSYPEAVATPAPPPTPVEVIEYPYSASVLPSAAPPPHRYPYPYREDAAAGGSVGHYEHETPYAAYAPAFVRAHEGTTKEGGAAEDVKDKVAGRVGGLLQWWG